MRYYVTGSGNLALAIPAFLVHLSLALALFVGLTWFYGWAQRFPFLAHVGNHNLAAAITYGSVQLGFAIPLAAALLIRGGWFDILVWAVPICITQFICYLVFDAIFGGLPRRIAANDVAVALMAGASRISVAIILAGSILD